MEGGSAEGSWRRKPLVFLFLPPSWGPVGMQGHAACGLGSGGAGPPTGLQFPSYWRQVLPLRPPIPTPSPLPVSATNVSLFTYLLLPHNPQRTLPCAKTPWEPPVLAWGTHTQTEPGPGVGSWRLGGVRECWLGTELQQEDKVQVGDSTSENSWAVLEPGAELSGMAGQWLDLQLDGPWEMGSYGRA